MARPCLICSNLEKTRLAAEMIAVGASDQTIADRLEVGRMSVHRHRHSHVVLPAPALEAAAARVTSADPPAPQSVVATPPVANAVASEQAIADTHRPAASRRRGGQGAPVDPAPATKAVAKPPAAKDVINAALGLGRQAEKLVRIEDRLERMGELAEKGLSPGQVATIATAQLRAIETGAKLAGVGGFAPMAAQMIGGGYDRPVFTVNIISERYPQLNQKIECLPWDGKARNFGQPASGAPRTTDAELEQPYGEAEDDRAPRQPADATSSEDDDLTLRPGSSAFSELVAAFGCRSVATAPDHLADEGGAADHDA